MGLAFVSAIWTCQEQPLRWTASREPAGFVTLQRDGCSVATCVRRSLCIEKATYYDQLCLDL